MRQRLDQALVQAGLVDSRETAQRLILAGEVLLNGQKAFKASQAVPEGAELALLAKPRFVSRGGEKLQGAFDAFGLDVTDLCCLDVGASTGGFTDCLLQHGARRVLALDVGTNQLHYRLRTDPRVWSKEQFNCRYLTPADLPEASWSPSSSPNSRPAAKTPPKASSATPPSANASSRKSAPSAPASSVWNG